MTLTDEQIAAVAHAANAEYCRQMGDDSQVSWGEAAGWQRLSAVQGVHYARSNPQAGPSAQHDAWLSAKEADGWRYGAVKDADKKEHPCCVPYDLLPPEQRLKDALFQGVVRALLSDANL